MGPAYDVVVVGSRVAGAPTAMLLARRGLKVLLLDRARFPSDTVSSHQLQVPGAAALHRWGLLDEVVDGGDQGVNEVRLDVDGIEMTGRLPTVDGAHRLISPRRSRLDDLLGRAADLAGADVEHGATVDRVLVDQDRVVGVGVKSRGGARTAIRANLVIGADGKHSFVAKAVGARSTRRHPNATVALYSYWSGVPASRAELYHRPGRAVAVFPTDGDLTVAFIAAPVLSFAEARSRPEAFLLSTLDDCGDLGERLRSGHRAERIRMTPDVPHVMREAAGPGWALVGDSGMVMDPVSAQGISNAFLSAELLDRSVGEAIEVGRTLDSGLCGYARQRDSSFGEMFDFTTSLAALAPRPGTRLLMSRVARRQSDIDRLLRVFSGVEPPSQFFSTSHVLSLLGPRTPGFILERARAARWGRGQVRAGEPA